MKQKQILMGQPEWEGSLGRVDTCICMAEFPCCPTVNMLYSKIKSIFKKWTQTENRHLVAKQGGGGQVGKENGSLELAKANCYIEWVDNKGPIVQHRKLYSISCGDS